MKTQYYNYYDFDGTQEHLENFLKDNYRDSVKDNNIEDSIYDDTMKNLAKTIVELANSEDESESDIEDEDFSLWGNYGGYSEKLKAHICVRKIIMDILVALALNVFLTQNLELNSLISSLLNLKNRIIKLDPSFYCIYLKIYRYGFQKGFTKEEFFNRCKCEYCNNRTKLWCCPVREKVGKDDQRSLENLKCYMNEDFFNDAIQSMYTLGIIRQDNSQKYDYILNE